MFKLKKHLSIMLALIVSVILLIPNMDLRALADESTCDLFNYDKELDVAVIIEYEHDDISFTITSPSGQMIDKNTDTDNITVFSGSTATIIFIGGAEAGQWTITYDKGSNDYLTVRSEVQNTEFWITSFNTSAVAEDKLPVTFNVTGGEKIRYSYSIMATTDRDTLNGKELSSGTASTDTDISVDVSLSDLSTYSEYYLLLYVSYDDNGSEIFDYAYSDAFSYTNPQSPDSLDSVDITIAHDSKAITVNWENHISYSTKSVYVEYYLDDELISSQEYPTSDGKSGFFTYDEETQVPLFKISVRDRSGLVSDFSEFCVNLVPDNSLQLTLPESGIVSSDIWSFDYSGADNTKVTFNINDYTETIYLDGDGTESITLPDTRNTIMVSYTDENGYVHTYNRMANITTITPSLSLSYNIDGITTTNNFIIISGTTNCSDVTINGNSAEVNDGIFIYTLKLEKGDNSILIAASSGDLATSLTATVTRTSAGIILTDSTVSEFLPLICGLAISFIGIILIILLTRIRNHKKQSKKENRKAVRTRTGFMWIFLSVLSWIATVGLWIWFIIRKVFENSVSYIELAYESLSKADAYLTHTVVILIFAIIITVLAIVFTVVSILVRHYIKKKNTMA